MAIPKEMQELIYQAVRFYEYAAGEGIFTDGIEHPDEALLKYAMATDRMDCEDFASVIRDALASA
jgi:hypothetical protein